MMFKIPSLKERHFQFDFITLSYVVLASCTLIFAINPNANPEWYAFTGLLLFGFLGAFFIIWNKEGRDGFHLGFDPQREVDTLLYSLLTFVIVGLVTLPVSFFLRHISIEKIGFTFGAPVAEGLFFTGFLFGASLLLYPQLMGVYWASFKSIFSAGLFAGFHVYVYSLTPFMFLYLFSAGMVYNMSYYFTGKISVPIVAHFLNNLTVMIIIGVL